jgi:hypothetical protein
MRVVDPDDTEETKNVPREPRTTPTPEAISTTPGDFAALTALIEAVAREQESADLASVRSVQEALRADLDLLEVALADLRSAIGEHRPWLEEAKQFLSRRELDALDAEHRPLIKPLWLEEVRRTCNEGLSFCANTTSMERTLQTLRGLNSKAALHDIAAPAFIDGWSRHIKGLVGSAGAIRSARQRLEQAVPEISRALERRKGIAVPATALPAPKTPERQRRALTDVPPLDAA